VYVPDCWCLSVFLHLSVARLLIRMSLVQAQPGEPTFFEVAHRPVSLSPSRFRMATGRSFHEVHATGKSPAVSGSSIGGAMDGARDRASEVHATPRRRRGPTGRGGVQEFRHIRRTPSRRPITIPSTDCRRDQPPVTMPTHAALPWRIQKWRDGDACPLLFRMAWRHCSRRGR
jgi:hypothetical protein